MKTRRIAAVLLGVALLASVGAAWLAPRPYAQQFRDQPNAAPSHKFLLGTDDLGRDRFSRVLYGARISFVLAPLAAAASTLLAALVGGLGGYFGGRWRAMAMGSADLFLSVPWLFLIVTVRALLPLNTSPAISVTITFSLLALLGWAAAARVISTAASGVRESNFVTMARACGCSRWRVFQVHVLPNLKPAMWAQFLISIPTFILAEANLSMLGLGVAEPLPSIGGLLRELENYSDIPHEPWRLAAAVLLVMVVSSFQVLLGEDEVMA